MSYSLSSIYNSTSWAISTHSRALGMLQEKASSGQEINRPSDNPVDSNRILSLNTDSRSLDRYLNSLSEMLGILDFNSSVVQQISSQMIDAVGYITSVSSGGGASDTVRTAIANQLDGVLEQVVSLVNTQHIGQYLFSGASSDTIPYAITRDSTGRISSVVYQGSNDERNVAVAPGVEESSVFSGDSLFAIDSRQPPVFLSADESTGITTTGATAGTATSSVRGDVTLTVSAYNSGTGAYTISIDGGLTTVTGNTADANAANVPVTHSVTGEVLYVNVSALTTTGTEAIRTPGTYDIFNVLISARNLMGDTTLPADQWNDKLSETISAMHNVEDKVTRAFPKIGGRISMLATLKNSLESIKYNTEDEISRLQDADIAQVAVDLAKHELLYEMSLVVASKMFSLSLMNFLR